MVPAMAGEQDSGEWADLPQVGKEKTWGGCLVLLAGEDSASACCNAFLPLWQAATCP